MINPANLTSVANAAKQLCMSRSGVYALLNAKELSSVRLGGHRLVHVTSIAQWLDKDPRRRERLRKRKAKQAQITPAGSPH